jgi:outer membrane protein assembly factor BamB
VRFARSWLAPITACAAAFGAMACPDGGSLTEAEGQLQLSPRRLDFGRVFVGERAVRTARLASVGQGSIEFRGRLSDGPGEGLVVGPAGGLLPAGVSVDVQVALEPTVEGQRDVQLAYVTATGTVTLTVLAQVEAPPDCEDGNFCTRNRFDLETGRCVAEVTTDACEDFDACTVQDRCVEGMCLGESRNCDDDNVCTDDFCDRQTGCVHVLNRDCDDGNPCTVDACDPVRGCFHVDAEDGTACAEGVPCTEANICVAGRCQTFEVMDGAPCDDQDPCSTQERCIDGACIDPTYTPPRDGELQWRTVVGPVAEDGARSPLIDVDGTILVAVEDGVVALDVCGAERWAQRTLGPGVRGDQMTILPRGLVVPQAGELVLLDRTDGAELDRLDLGAVHRVDTSTTDRVHILAVAARTSGALVGSLWLDRAQGEDEGLLVEVDPGFRAATVHTRLGPRHAPHLALDADEAIVAVLREGSPSAPGDGERLARLGLFDLPETRWTTDVRPTVDTEVAIDAAGRIWWTSGLTAITRNGVQEVRIPPPLQSRPDVGRSAPVVDRDRIYRVAPGPAGAGAARLQAWTLTSTAPVLDLELFGDAAGSTPAVDRAGNVFVATTDGRVSSFDRAGRPRYELDLETTLAAPAIAIGPGENLIVVDGTRVFSVQSDRGLAQTAWPRRRRDNFGTAHR